MDRTYKRNKMIYFVYEIRNFVNPKENCICISDLLYSIQQYAYSNTFSDLILATENSTMHKMSITILFVLLILTMGYCL